MESENDIDYYMLNCSDDYRPQNIYPHQNAFYYEKDMEHNAIVTLIAINKCGKISSKSNSLFLPVIKSMKNYNLMVDYFIHTQNMNFSRNWKHLVYSK